MSLPKYAEYKDSGIPWIGHVPANWEVAGMKRLLDIQNGADYKAVEQNEGFPVIGSGGQFTYASNYLYDGESVLLGRKGTIDKPLYFKGKFWTVDTMYWSKVLPIANGRFAYYASLTIPFGYYSTNTALPSMTKSALGAHLIAQPPIEEQAAIAAFLDRETAKIDALIVEQEKLIALLAEKRQATISHAVTRGLNPNAPMKDSGVSWLGEVPTHWKFKRIKHIKAEIPNAFVDGPFGSNLKSEHFIENGDVFVIESNFATQNKIDEGELKTISHAHFETIARSEVSADDIVIAKIGAQFGKASILPPLSKRSVVSGNSLKLTVNPNLCLNNWAYFQLVNLKSVGEIDLLANGSAQPALSLGGMNNLPVIIPPLNEQIEILKFIASEMNKLDSLKVDAEHSIELLKERRSALITAAVTGQIDVRGLVEPQPS